MPAPETPPPPSTGPATPSTSSFWQRPRLLILRTFHTSRLAATVEPSDAARRQVSGVKRRDSAHTVNAVTTTHCRTSRKTELHCRSPARQKPLTIGNGDSYHASALASTLVPSSDGPPALVAHSPSRVSPALFGRDAVKARDALLGQCPLGQPRGVRRRGYSPTDTAHEMRIPLRPLRMSKPYRRLRKRSLRSD